MSDREPDAARTHRADLSGREARYNRDLGANVREARLTRSVTQGDLADKVGVSRGSIANLERGAQAPTAYRLQTIADALGCEVAELLPQVREDISALMTAMPESFSQSLLRVMESSGGRK